MKAFYHFYLTILLVLFCSFHASAQFRFGIKAGLNLATVAASSDLKSFYEDEYTGAAFKPDFLPSFNAGVLGEYDFNGTWGIGAGLNLSGKGYRLKQTISDEFGGYTYKEKITPLYLQVPLSLNFHKNGFFAGVGPYVSFGLSGKFNASYEEDGDVESYKGDLTFSNDFNIDDEDNEVLAANIRPLDIGAGLELGYEFGHFRVTASYQLGFSNIYSKDLVKLAKDEGEIDNFKASNSVIGINAAYMFGSRNK